MGTSIWRKSRITAALLLGAVIVSGCSHKTTDVQVSDRSAEFRSDFAAKPGLARVYILPTFSKNLYTDLDGHATIVIHPDGGGKGAELGTTSKTAFIAFDIGPGTYDLGAFGDGILSRVKVSETFDAGAVYFLRPTFFRSTKDIAADPSKTPPGFGFDVVSPEVAEAEIRHLNMVAITPRGDAFLARTLAQPVTPAAAPYMPATPSGQPSFTDVERKLRELRQLRDENLISQEDYDEKRRALLNAY